MPKVKGSVERKQKLAKAMTAKRMERKKWKESVDVTPSTSHEPVPSTSPFPSSPPVTSAVKRKSLLASGEKESEKKESGKKDVYFLCSEDEISEFAASMLCPSCFASVSVKFISHQIDVFFSALCDDCGKLFMKENVNIKKRKTFTPILLCLCTV